MFEDIIKNVEKDNIIQIVTNNGSVIVKAVKKHGKYNLYWTYCEAQCIDLMFEYIDKQEIMTKVIERERMVPNYIYNHVYLFVKMCKIC